MESNGLVIDMSNRSVMRAIARDEILRAILPLLDDYRVFKVRTSLQVVDLSNSLNALSRAVNHLQSRLSAQDNSG